MRQRTRLRGVSEEMQIAARALRQRETPAEKALWRALRGGKLDGLKFRRQHAVASFAADFYCPAHHLVVEVDGPIHDDPEQQIRDANKDAYFQALGNTVLRLSNDQVLNNLPAALNRIRITLTKPANDTPFPPGRGKGAGG